MKNCTIIIKEITDITRNIFYLNVQTNENIDEYGFQTASSIFLITHSGDRTQQHYHCLNQPDNLADLFQSYCSVMSKIILKSHKGFIMVII